MRLKRFRILFYFFRWFIHSNCWLCMYSKCRHSLFQHTHTHRSGWHCMGTALCITRHEGGVYVRHEWQQASVRLIVCSLTLPCTPELYDACFGRSLRIHSMCLFVCLLSWHEMCLAVLCVYIEYHPCFLTAHTHTLHTFVLGVYYEIMGFSTTAYAWHVRHNIY